MVLSIDNAAAVNGNETSPVIRKIHNMMWLKQAATPKYSEHCKKKDDNMFNALAELKEDDQSGPEKKNRRKRNKKTNGGRDKERANKHSQLPIVPGQVGVKKSAWSTNENAAESLFPNASETARQNLPSEEEQMKMAMEASLETAFLEKCVVDRPDDAKVVDDAYEEPEEENIWTGTHQNLPSPNSEEFNTIFDPNNNSGANKSQSSNVALKSIDDKVDSNQESNITKIEAGSETRTIAVVPLDVPKAPDSSIGLFDRFGRVGGYSEKHMFIGKGTRMKEEALFRHLQEVTNGSQQTQPHVVGPQDSHRPSNTPADNSHNDNHGAAKVSSDKNREGNPQDAQHSRKAPVDNSHNDYHGVVKESNEKNHNSQGQDSHLLRKAFGPRDNAQNDSHGATKGPSEKNRYSDPPQDSHYPRNAHLPRDNSQNDNHGGAKGSNEKNRYNKPQDYQRPRNVSASGDNMHNGNHGVTRGTNDINRSNNPRLDSHRPRSSHVAQENSYGDNYESTKRPSDINRYGLSSQESQNSRNHHPPRRSMMHVQPNHSYNRASESYDPAKDPYKYQKPNASNYNKRNYHQHDGAYANDNARSDDNKNRDIREKKIDPLLSAKMERPSSTEATIKETARQDRSDVEKSKQVPIQIESEIRRKEIEDLPVKDVEKPKVHLSDFNSRFNMVQEQVSMPINPIAASLPMNPCVSTPFVDYKENGSSCQTSEIPTIPARFTVPPPGFGSLLSAQHSSNNAPDVMPADSSLCNPPYIVTADNPTSSAYVLPAETPSGVSSDIAIRDAVYASLKIHDPNLYNLLLQKEEQMSLMENSNRNVAAAAVASCSMIPEIRNDNAINPSVYQDTRILGNTESDEFPVEQQRSQMEMLNPNAKQFCPMSKQGWASLNQPDPLSCFSVATNYDSQSSMYNSYAGQPQDNSGWNISSSNSTYNAEQTPQHRLNATTNESAPTPILGRQNYLVSESNYPYQNDHLAAINNQQLNDNYAHCQISGYEHNIRSNDVAQRQVPYRVLPHCGTARNYCCMMPCAASYGSQTQAANSKYANFGTQTTKAPLHYADCLAMSQNQAIMHQGNQDLPRRLIDQPIRAIAVRDVNYVTNSIIQSQSMIQPSSHNVNKPGMGRGRARLQQHK